MAVYWGTDFGIRVIVLGILFAVSGIILGSVCSLSQVSPGPTRCVEYGFGGWNWALLISGIGLIVVGVVSAVTGREPPEPGEPLD